MNERFEGAEKVAEWFLRLALAAAFLSAVADRLGLWGAPGDPGVAWGGWDPFVAYTGTLNWFLPEALVPLVAWAATVAEVACGIGLIVGWRLRWFALASGALLLSFALAMTLESGLKGPLEYSVFTASAAAFYLGTRRRIETS